MNEVLTLSFASSCKMDCLTACAKAYVHTLVNHHPTRSGRCRAESKCSLPLPFPRLLRFANRTTRLHHIPFQICACADANASSKAEVAAESSGDTTVRVKLVLQKECLFGQKFSVVGEDPQFGSWDVQAAIPLNWSEGHVWTAELDIPVGKRIQFKFLLTGVLGEIEWQPGPDRSFHTWETKAVIVVSEDWESADLQRVTEEAIGVPSEDVNTMSSACESKLNNSHANDTCTEVPTLVLGLETLVDAKEEEGICSKNAVPTEPNARGHTTSLAFRSKGSILDVSTEVHGLATMVDCTEEDRSSNKQAVIANSNERGHPAFVDASSKAYSSGPRAATPFKAEELQSSSQEEILGQSYVGNQSHLLDNCEGSAATSPYQISASVAVDEDVTATKAQMSSTTELFKNDKHRTSDTNCSEGDGFDSNMCLGANQPLEDSANCQPDTSVLEGDFDWGRKILSKLMWSLGLKHEDVEEQDKSK